MSIPKKKPTPEPDDAQRAFGIDPDNIPENIQSEDLTPWLKEEAWPQPKWFTKAKADGKMLNKNFDSYVMDTLRWRYTRLEGDFRTVFNNYFNTKYVDKVTARRIISFLESAREALEKDNCDPLDVSNLLDMADQYMVWLFPPHVANVQMAALTAQLKTEGNPWGDYLAAETTREGATLGSYRAALDRVKQATNDSNQITQVNNGLQIERLEMLTKWGLVVTIVMLIGIPLVTKSKEGIFDGSVIGDYVVKSGRQWLVIPIIALIGAVGAFLSGLLQMRRSKITIGEFKENVMQFRLRLIVGAIFAMMVSMLLTWDIISGVEIKNAGAYVLIAFLCGFSERYFLNLLRIDEEGNSTIPQGAPIVAANTSKPTDAINETVVPENPNDVKMN